MLQLAQADEHVGDVDLDRARGLAGTAQGRCVRQVGIVGHAVVQRRQNTADRPGVDAAIGMTADAPIDRTGVEAGPAADAG